MINQVALILDRTMTKSILTFIGKMPTWIVQSAENDRIVNELRHQLGSNNLITTFPEKEGESQKDLAERILLILDDHHNENSYSDIYNTLLVSGIKPQVLNANLLHECGFKEFEETDFGFIARKSGSED